MGRGWRRKSQKRHPGRERWEAGTCLYVPSPAFLKRELISFVWDFPPPPADQKDSSNAICCLCRKCVRRGKEGIHMGTSAPRSHLKINHLGPDPESTCLALSLNDTGAVHVHGTFCKVLEEDERGRWAILPPASSDWAYVGRAEPFLVLPSRREQGTLRRLRWRCGKRRAWPELFISIQAHLDKCKICSLAPWVIGAKSRARGRRDCLSHLPIRL